MSDNLDDKMVDNTFIFLSARLKAEQEGTKEFKCPLCGGEAWWDRAPSNGHLRCGCRKCGIKIMV